jgi:hypothetical protein
VYVPIRHLSKRYKRDIGEGSRPATQQSRAASHRNCCPEAGLGTDLPRGRCPIRLHGVGTASDKAALIRAAIDALKMIEVLTGGVSERREQQAGIAEEGKEAPRAFEFGQKAFAARIRGRDLLQLVEIAGSGRCVVVNALQMRPVPVPYETDLAPPRRLLVAQAHQQIAERQPGGISRRRHRKIRQRREFERIRGEVVEYALGFRGADARE